MLDEKQKVIDSALLNKMANDIKNGKTVQLNIFNEASINTYFNYLTVLCGIDLVYSKLFFKYSRVCKEILDITTVHRFYGINITRQK